VLRDAAFKALGNLTPSFAVDTDGVRVHVDTADQEISRLVYIYGLYDKPLMTLAFSALGQLGGRPAFEGTSLAANGLDDSVKGVRARAHRRRRDGGAGALADQRRRSPGAGRRPRLRARTRGDRGAGRTARRPGRGGRDRPRPGLTRLARRSGPRGPAAGGRDVAARAPDPGRRRVLAGRTARGRRLSALPRARRGAFAGFVDLGSPRGTSGDRVRPISELAALDGGLAAGDEHSDVLLVP